MTQEAGGPSYSISVSPGSKDVSSGATSFTLTITATNTPWTASVSDSSMLSISSSSGPAGTTNITVSVTANSGSSERTGRVTVTGTYGGSDYCPVTQDAAGGGGMFSWDFVVTYGSSYSTSSTVAATATFFRGGTFVHQATGYGNKGSTGFSNPVEQSYSSITFDKIQVSFSQNSTSSFPASAYFNSGVNIPKVSEYGNTALYETSHSMTLTYNIGCTLKFN